MKNNKRIFAGITVLVLLFGLVLVGCVSITYVETETSLEIYKVAVDLVNSRTGGISASALLSGLSNQFPGLKLQPMGMSFGSININYGGTAKEPKSFKI
ncbi:MAG: hypothetical protein FWG07_09590 [Treponema sp.]|nr:hypothetical protein [Treponema sp.]